MATKRLKKHKMSNELVGTFLVIFVLFVAISFFVAISLRSTNAVVHWLGEALSNVRSAGVRELEARSRHNRGVRTHADACFSTRLHYLRVNRKAASR